jgi:LAO/AO transport system kinase
LTAKTPSDFESSLWDAFFEGSRRACARLITRVENEPGVVPSVRDRLAPRLGKAVRIGITGPPGVGKSTLTAAIAKGLGDAGHRIGVIAVDPSSPFTGGAFMGDRIRMEGLIGDERVFIRSMASRKGHGGLSQATPYVADVLEGFGMDRILIETVGVGQSELDVLNCADLVVLVLQPGTGDSIQTMKAGIIEAADLIVVNKADQPGVDSVIQSLRFLFSLSGPIVKKTSPKPPPVLSASALQNQGIDEVIQEIEKLTAVLVESGRHLELRRRRLADEIRAEIQGCLWEAFDAQAKASDEIGRIATELAVSGKSPYPYIRSVCDSIKITLRPSKED